VSALTLASIRQAQLELKSAGELALYLPKSLEWDARYLTGFVCATTPGALPAVQGEIGRLGRVRVLLIKDAPNEDGSFNVRLCNYPDPVEGATIVCSPSALEETP
jgi:hypothetical protein